MPELPEVETTVRGIAPTLLATRCQEVLVRQAQLRWPVSPTLSKQFSGQTIISITRRAKYILLQTINGTAIIHLGMSGRLRLCPQQTIAAKHDHIDFMFEHCILRYTDPRRFGAILWTSEDPLTHRLLKSLGPEPLSKNFDGVYLQHALKARKISIKAAIMNHHIVVGVGNIYASEALFLAKINPKKIAATLTPAECARLVESIQQILRAAIQQGGTTLKDFFNSDGKPGYFRQKLQVYGRKGQACEICQHPIQACMLSQRNTFYCEHCQQDNAWP